VLTIEISNIPHLLNQSVQITTDANGVGRGRITYGTDPSSIDWCYLTQAERNRAGIVTAYNQNNQAVGTGALVIFYLYAHRADVGDCFIRKLYRLRNGGSHFYTVDFGERDDAIRKHGYVSEGVLPVLFIIRDMAKEKAPYAFIGYGKEGVIFTR